MIKRIAAAVLAFIIVFSLVSCSKARNAGGNGSIIAPIPAGGKPELRILVHTNEYEILTKTKYIKEYIGDFEKGFGVEVRIEKLGSDFGSIIRPEELEEYIKKLSVKLYLKDGPELLFTRNVDMAPLINQQALADMRGKVKNVDKIYGSLLGEKVFYAPLGIRYFGRPMNRTELAELNIGTPSLDWTSEEYFNIRNQWVAKEKPLFNAIEYEKAFGQYFYLPSLLKAGENKILLNTPEVRQKISDVRAYVFGGNYQQMPNYNYKNYYNMLFEDASEEANLSWKYTDINEKNGHIDSWHAANIFSAKNVHDRNLENNTVMFPEFKDRVAFIDSYGFLINKNGKHLNLAYEFVNGLLTDEIQLGMVKEKDFFGGESYIGGFYPVSEEIEAEILKLEEGYGLEPKAVQLKAYALLQLKEGKCRLKNTAVDGDYKILSEIYKDLTKLILADSPYSDEQLQAELKKMEDRYNIYLNE